MDYDTLRPFLIWPHGLLGAVVLLLGVVVLVLPKGTPRHVALGRVFYWAMLASVALAVPMMLLRGNWLLLLLSVLSFYMLVSGRREVQRHRAGGLAVMAPIRRCRSPEGPWVLGASLRNQGLCDLSPDDFISKLHRVAR